MNPATKGTQSEQARQVTAPRRPYLVWVGASVGVLVGVLAIAGITWAIVAKFKAKPPAVADFLSPEEQELVDLTNQARTSSGLPPLKVDPVLCAVAKMIATQMSEQGIHYGLSRDDLVAHLRSQGYTEQMAGMGGTNVQVGQPVAEIFKLLSESKDANQTVMGSSYEEVGVGIVLNESHGRLYVAQLFGLKAK